MAAHPPGGTLLAPAPYTRFTPTGIPDVHGSLLIVACGDSRLFDEDNWVIPEILRATGAGWGFIKTFAGGSVALVRDSAVACQTFTEVADLEVAKGQFAAAVDLAHFHCAGLRQHQGNIPAASQLSVIRESQEGAVGVFSQRFIGRPVFHMVYDPVTKYWW